MTALAVPEVRAPLFDVDPAVDRPVTGRVVAASIRGHGHPAATYEAVVVFPAEEGTLLRLGPVALVPSRVAPEVALWPRDPEPCDHDERDDASYDDGYDDGHSAGKAEAQGSERRLEDVLRVADTVHTTLHPGPFRFCSDPICSTLHRDVL